MQHLHAIKKLACKYFSVAANRPDSHLAGGRAEIPPTCQVQGGISAVTPASLACKYCSCTDGCNKIK